MKKPTLILFVFALLYAPFAFAQTQTNVQRAQVETMFGAFVPGKIKLAMTEFAKGSLVPPELVDQVASQAETVISVNNPILGFEFVREQNVSESVKQISYVLKLSDRPLFWDFTFYKPTKDWLPLRMYFVE